MKNAVLSLNLHDRWGEATHSINHLREPGPPVLRVSGQESAAQLGRRDHQRSDEKHVDRFNSFRCKAAATANLPRVATQECLAIWCLQRSGLKRRVNRSSSRSWSLRSTWFLGEKHSRNRNLPRRRLTQLTSSMPLSLISNINILFIIAICSYLYCELFISARFPGASLQSEHN